MMMINYEINIYKKYPEIQYDEWEDLFNNKIILRYATIIDNIPFFNLYNITKENILYKNKIKNMLKDNLIIAANKYLNFKYLPILMN